MLDVTPAPDVTVNAPFDTGAGALAVVLHRLGLQASESEFLYISCKPRLDAVDILTIARRFPVRAGESRLTARQLPDTPLPALGRLRDGSWIVIVQIVADHVVIQDPNAGAPARLSLADYDEIADGCVVTIVHQRGLARDLGIALNSLGAEALRSVVRRLRGR